MKNWEEDFSLESGKYQNRCTNCDSLFLGHKYRRICKECYQRWEKSVDDNHGAKSEDESLYRKGLKSDERVYIWGGVGLAAVGYILCNIWFGWKLTLVLFILNTARNANTNFIKKRLVEMADLLNKKIDLLTGNDKINPK